MEWNAEEVIAEISAKVSGWVEGSIEMLPNMGVAVVVVVFFWLLAKIFAHITRASMGRASDNQAVINLVSTIVKVSVVLVGLFIALSVLKLDGTVTSLLAGVGIVGLALGFAFQDIAANFVSGVLLAMRRPFKVGDMIETNGYFATVERIDLRSTILRTFTGQMVTLPNKDVFGNAIVNYDVTGEWRIDLAVGVAYGDDLEKAERVTIEAIEGLGMRHPDKPVQLWYTEFGDSSINLSVRFWIRMDEHSFLEGRHRAIKAIKKAYDENDITIPFPIRTLDFGVVGGERLADALPAGMGGGRGGRPS